MDFSKQSAAALLLATFSIAAVHALIPSHWLSFAVVGRNQRWTLRKTLLVTLLAGTGHLLLTLTLGLILTLVGKGLLKAIPAWAEHAATGIVLIALGVWFALPNLRRGSSGCHHAAHAHSHVADLETLAPHEEMPGGTEGAGTAETSPPHSSSPSRLARLGSAPTAMGALILGMTLSPCLDLLSIFVGASALPWTLLAAISLTMSVTTLSLMLLLVALTLRGLEKLKLDALERYEGLAVGSILVVLGVVLFFLR